MSDEAGQDLAAINAEIAPVAETEIVKIYGTGAAREGNIVQYFVEDRLIDRFCWVQEYGWMGYEQGRFIECPEATLIEVARLYVLKRVQAAAAAGKEAEINIWAKYIDRSKLNNLVGLARGIVQRKPSEFDTHTDLLNCLDSVANLRTGESMPQSPHYLFTKTTKIRFRPDAVHKDWDAALEALPDDKRAFFHDRVGQGITGEMVPDDVLIVQQGGGENGKTTVMYGIRQAIGEYFTLVSDRMLMVNPNAHPTELMDLQGARLALVEETPEARQLNVKRLKDVVGTPEIKARRMKKDSVTFPATHSLMLNTNYELVVTETDHGTWRRLALLVWPYRFRKPHELIEKDTDRRGDDMLRQRIRDDVTVHEAALAWLVRGAVQWYARGRRMLEQPVSVECETAAWRAKSDAVLRYIRDNLTFDREIATPITVLEAHFNAWLQVEIGTTWRGQQFKDRFLNHDMVPSFVELKTVRRDKIQLNAQSWAYLEGTKSQTVKAYQGVGLMLRTSEDAELS